MATLGTMASATVLMFGLAAVRASACGAWPAGWLATTLAAGTPFWRARAPTNTARATTARKASPTTLLDRRRATDGDATGATSRFGGHPQCAQLNQDARSPRIVVARDPGAAVATDRSRHSLCPSRDRRRPALASRRCCCHQP